MKLICVPGNEIVLTFKKDYSENVKKGFVVYVDKIQSDEENGSIKCRIVNIESGPITLSSSWFQEFKNGD